MAHQRKTIDSGELFRSINESVADSQGDHPQYSQQSSTSPSLSFSPFPATFPSVKRIPSTRFVVDGFRNAGPWSSSYFLSHFHSDHYAGLSNIWNKGIIFCSDITARLVLECIKVSPAFVYALPMGETVQIDDVLVTLVEANHCPGAVQMLFQVPQQGSHYLRYVHTGDMRYSTQMSMDPSLCDFVGADAVFLDTTYCNPKFVFPSQLESIDYIADTIYNLKHQKHEEGMGSNNETDLEIEDISCGTVPCTISGGGVEMFCSSSIAEDQDSVVKDERHPAKHRQIDSYVSNDEKCGEPNTRLTTMHGVSGSILSEQPETVAEDKLRKTGPTVYLISTYVIGKEKILLAVAKRCNCLIYVDEKKYAILKCLDLDNFEAFTTDSSATDVHVVSWSYLGETWPYFRPNFKKMEQLLNETGCSRVVGFVPTGWTYEIKKKVFSVRRKGPLEIHLVPYSEHSNYEELRQYISFLRPKEIIPTVGIENGEMDSKAVASMRKHFRNLVDETASKRQFLKGFKRRLQSAKLEESVQTSTCAGEQSTVLLTNDACVQQSRKLGTDQKVGNVIGSQADVQSFPKAVFGKGTKKRERDKINLSNERGMVPSVAISKKQHVEALNMSHNVVLKKVDSGSITLNSYINGPKKVEELHAILPAEVNTEQVIYLLEKANGDLDRAVSIFFEKGVSEVGRPNSESKQENHDFFLSASLTKYDSEVCSPEPSTNAVINIHGDKKPAKRAMPKSRRRSNASQSSILSFFKRTELSSESGSNIEEVECVQLEQTQKTLGIRGGLHVENANVLDGLEQLLTILGGSLSKDRATTLLKQAGGDVNAALDLHYNGIIGSGSALAAEAAAQAQEAVAQPAKNNACKPILSSQNVNEQPFMQKESRLELNTFSVALPTSEYKPIEHACWRHDESAPYLHLARSFELIEQESGRLKTSDMMCNMFRSLLALSPEAVLPAMYLATNRIAPDYENVDLNIGGSTVSAAIAEATGTPRLKLREMYNKMGDLGDVAQACRQTQTLLIAPQTLSIQEIYSTLWQISKETGSGSGSRKKGLILGLLRACREKEMKYIVRTLVQNMRIGAMMRSVLPALAQAVVLSTSHGKAEELKTDLQRAGMAMVEAYNLLPNLNVLVPSLLRDGIQAVFRVNVSPGIPVKPMLAKIKNGIPDLFKMFLGKAFTCEYKYDGQRAQVHVKKDGSIKIFSRNCEETTTRFPDVVSIVREGLKPDVDDLILDAEIVAVDREMGNKLLPFQHLSTRERGRIGSVISVENIKVDVCIFIFDLMFVNGKALVKKSFRERRRWMHDSIMDAQAGRFGFASEITIEAAEANVENSNVVSRIEAFLDEAISSSCEGIMVKALDEESAYIPSKRSDSWLKIKRDYIEGLHDTLDLVPIGAWYGNGRKAGWYSPFLVACYDPDREEFQSVCRVMSGFTDSFYKQMKEFYSGDRILQRKPTYYQTLEEPDVWFLSELVWEIRGADFTISPVHQAALGLVHSSRGISLRFPRFIKDRSDKKPEEASSPVEIADLYHQQSRKLDIAGHNMVKQDEETSQ